MPTGRTSASKARMPTAAPPIFQVKLVPQPIVIDANGLPVSNAHVVEIVFPGDVIETNLGKVNTIVGPGVAKVIVGEVTYRGVPLC